MKFSTIVSSLIISSLSFQLWANQAKDFRKEKLVGNILKSALETYHYRGMKISDDVSQKAYIQYIKSLDGFKQFLLKSDVKELEAFQFQMDDEMLNGDYALVDKSMSIMKKRIQFAEKVRQEFFKKQTDFNGNEKIESDADKREFAKDENQLKENWKLTFKQQVLSRYLAYLDEQSENGKDKKDKSKTKKKIEKKMTDAEMRTKSHESVAKKFQKYFDRLLTEDREDQLDKFYNAIARVYDPHTDYLAPKKKEDFDIDIKGELEGIGAVLQEENDYIKVVQIVPGGAAWRQKDLEVDDLILSVSQGTKGEPVDLVGMKVEDAVRYIRGKKGTDVCLNVKKGSGTRKNFCITRDVVQVAASFAKSSVLQLKDSNVKVGYIQLPKFYRDFENSTNNCTDDVRKELERVKKAGVDAVVLDLRNNGGGALEDARLMSGLFIDKGPIVQVKDHMGKIEVLEDDNPGIVYDGPLIVLINRFSASASEILAGAMQDYGRAVIIGGDFSHGKGTVQAVLNLNQGPLLSMFGDLGSLKVTIQKFYRVTGASTQYKGVVPDVILPDPFSYVDSREKDLEYSLPWDQISSRNFNRWTKFSYPISSLKEKSAQRVKANPAFGKINKAVDYLIKKKKDTLVSLNLKQLQDEEIQNKKIADDLKFEDENKSLLVTNFEDSLRAHENIRPSEMKKWKKDFEQRKDEWIKGLRQDLILSEAMNVAGDIVSGLKSVVKK